jgi:hypothetical protein
LVLPSGNTVHQSPLETAVLISKKKAVWIEEGVSAMRVVSQEFGDYSAVQGDHYKWKPRDSGGAVVMQLT